MKKRRELIEKIFYLSQKRISMAFRQMSPIRLVVLLFILVYSLSIGIFLAFAFLGILQESNFQQPIAYRDLMTFAFLTFFVTIQSYSILTGATGIRNPFISGRQDAHFFQRIPVESAVMHISAKITEFLKITPLVVVIVVPLFSPLIWALHVQWWRILVVLIVCLLTINFSGNIADLAFFTFRRLRRKGKWALIWLDSNSPIFWVIFLGPSIAYLMTMLNYVPTFEILSHYIPLPFINTAVAATGFFFRSGIPRESWIALLILLLETIVLAIVTNILMAKYRPMEDITEIIPVLSFQAAQLEDLIGGKTIEPSELTDEDIKGKTSFCKKSPVNAFILKDWLAIKRIRTLRKHLYWAPLIVIGLTITAMLLIIPKGNQSYYTLLLLAIYPMADFALLLTRLEIKEPMQRFPVKKWDIRKSKILLILLGTSFYGIPLFIAKGPIGLLIIVLVTGVSIIIGKTKWGAVRSRIFLLFGIALLTTPLLIWG
ncbi:MAG: hypothetical protein ACFFDI_28395 [Promethearchaeota archaeon]